MTLPEFSIDTVLEALVKAGGKKIDFDQPDPSGNPGRNCPPGTWSTWTDTDASNLAWVSEEVRNRLHHVSLHIDNDGQIHMLFDPVTRQIEAMEVTELDTGGLLLTLSFWPGMDAAKAIYRSTMDHWKRVLADLTDGMFKGGS